MAKSGKPHPAQRAGTGGAPSRAAPQGDARALIRQIDQMAAEGATPEALLRCYEAWLPGANDRLGYMVWFNYGALLQQIGRIEQAVSAYEHATALAPNFAPPIINLGLCEEAMGRPERAVAMWEAGLPHFATSSPELVQLKIAALNHLARVTEDLKDYRAAQRYLGESLGLDPAQPDAIHHWVHLQQRTCQWPVFRPMPGVPESAQLLSTSPFAMLAYSDDPALQLLSAREYLHRKFPAMPAARHRGGSYLKTRQGRLKIGYVSGDFCMHAVGLLMPSVLESHDRTRVELYLYDFSREDGSPLRARLLGCFDHLRSIKRLSDEQAASLIIEDGIDVLIDMHGLSQGARPWIFAQRPAPQQGQYLGFIGSTGMPWLDFVVVDRYVFTEGLAPYFTEQPLFVEGCFLPLTAAEVAVVSRPTRAQCGLPEDGFVLAAFGNSYKITEPMFALWMRVMRSEPHTVLWILDDNPQGTEALRQAAIAAGVAPARLIFQPRVPYGEFCARLRLADLFLDAYPYNCGSTARDIVQAGLPMVTLSGRTMISRMGGSVLTALGLTEGIATSFEQYEQKVLQHIARGTRRGGRASGADTSARSHNWGRGVSFAMEQRWLGV